MVLCAAPMTANVALAEILLPGEAFSPSNLSISGSGAGDPSLASESVETFDPVARALLLAREIPRSWVGTYQSFDTGSVVPVELTLASLQAQGQMVDLRGEMRIGDEVAPVQANLNAESDQLDLLLLCGCITAGLERGGVFSGLQGLGLSGWLAPRLSSQGGRLDLRPAVADFLAMPAPVETPIGTPVRGLW